MLLLVLLFGVSFVKKGEFPPKEDILPELRNIPLMGSTDEREFTMTYAGKDYDIAPMKKYELWGLVVSHNKVGSISDSYHEEDAVDLKDICVVWGKNIESDVYREMKFKSGSWTCYPSYNSKTAHLKWDDTMIGNNHLLAEDPLIQDAIRGIHVGDQIHMEGMLVKYSPEGTSWWRVSSLDFNDSSCEVVFVESIEILKRGTPRWYAIFTLSLWGILACFVLKIILIIIQGQAEKMRIRGIEENVRRYEEEEEKAQNTKHKGQNTNEETEIAKQISGRETHEFAHQQNEEGLEDKSETNTGKEEEDIVIHRDDGESEYIEYYEYVEENGEEVKDDDTEDKK